LAAAAVVQYAAAAEKYVAAHQISLRQFSRILDETKTAIQTRLSNPSGARFSAPVMKLIEAPIHKARPRATPRSLSFCAMISC